MRTHDTWAVSSTPTCVTVRMQLAMKAKGNHLIKSTSTEKLRALSLVSATLEIEYATQLDSQLGLN